LIGLGSVATFTVGNFDAVYNKDGTDFGTGYSAINAVTGLTASGTLALNAGGFVDAVASFDTQINTAASSFALTLNNPSLFVGPGGGVDASGAYSAWAVTTTGATGFSVTAAPAGSITLVGANGEFGLAAAGLTVALIGPGSVATFTVGNFDAVYNKDGTDFGTGYSAINAVTGLTASGTLALNAGGFVGAVASFDTQINTAASSFALTRNNPSLFVGTGGGVDTSGAYTAWAVTTTGATGFSVTAAPAGSITLVGANGEFGVAAPGLTVALIGLGSVATFTVGNFDAVYNKDGTNFGTGYSAINAVTGLTASGTLALNAGGFVDAVASFDTQINTAASSFALTLNNPSLFVGTGGGVDTSGAYTAWAVTTTGATGFSVTAAPAGSITLVGANGEFGLAASGLTVALIGLGSVATF